MGEIRYGNMQGESIEGHSQIGEDIWDKLDIQDNGNTWESMSMTLAKTNNEDRI